jgi:hypothetical protein
MGRHFKSTEGKISYESNVEAKRSQIAHGVGQAAAGDQERKTDAMGAID